MQSRRLGNSDVTISPIIMGTWQAGKKMWAGIDDGEIAKALKAAFDSGVTTFDTAEEYGWGHSERMVGKTLAPVRHEAVYATKVFANHLAYRQVMEACERSLRNLKTDYIDLYQIHWPAGSWGTETVPIEETMGAMYRLKEQGKIRAVGVSNFSPAQIEEALQYGPVHSLQPPYSLFWRQVERDAFPYCRERGITILAYSPLSQGILTGRLNPGRFAKGDHRKRHRLFQPENFKRVQKALQALSPIARRLGITLAQLALAWVIAQPGTCAVAGARNAEQARQNALASKVQLSDGDLQELDRISRRVTDYLDDNPVMWAF